jgi:lysophospholipase L1-like esterase
MRLPLFALPLLMLSSSALAERTVVIGDSGSEEYAVEVVFSAPATSNGHQAKNWVELLAENRRADFEFGRYREPFSSTPFLDIRTWGYESNFSFPGNETEDGANIVTGDSVVDSVTRSNLSSYLSGWAEQVVIFLGANDLRNDYDALYNNESGAEAAYINKVTTNLTTILDFVTDLAPNAKVVVVNVPDVGASPDQKSSNPDAALRLRPRQATANLNVALANLAMQYGAAVADIFSTSVEIADKGGVSIGGVWFNASSAPSNDPKLLFTRDDFHPNSSAQLLYARAVIDALNTQTGASIPQISDQEFLDILGLSSGSQGFAGSTSLGNGWYRLANFGDYQASSFPWIYHTDLGWVYAATTDPKGLWLYSASGFGFFWTATTVYPSLHHHNSGTWNYLSSDNGENWLYNFTSGDWSRAPF